jgi:hypothetical protein
MSAGLRPTRRSLLRRVFQAFAAGRLASSLSQAASFEIDDPAVRSASSAGKANSRRYRVQAAVSLFDPTGLPSKIEFRPKSFLHLTFHQDPAAGGPSVRRLVVQEEA